jgi:hemoglobin
MDLLEPPVTPALHRDLESESDIETVVRAFYLDMESDPVIGSYFAGLDWPTHLPRMVRFWSSIVFHTGEYSGRPFDPHSRMPGLDRPHFAHWVSRFHATVDDHFSGERAAEMKDRAEQIAGVFQVKLGLWATGS